MSLIYYYNYQERGDYKMASMYIVSEILGRERNQNSGFSDSQLSGSTVIKTTEVIIRMLSL